MHIALIVLRLREPKKKRPFRVPLAIGRIPVLPALGLAAVLVLITQIEAQALLGGAVLIALTLGGYALLSWRKAHA